MTLTIVECCPPWLYKLTFGTKHSSSVHNYQVTNQKISCEGTCQQKSLNNYKACPKSTSAAQRPTIPTCALPPCQKFDQQENTMDHQGRFLGFLENVREPLANYQDKRGLPKSEQYGFVNLVTSLCQHAYNAILTILTMLYNLLPLLEGFLYLTRFVLDKLIEICQTQEKTDKILKIVLFIGEMVVILLMVMIICGFILFPVWYLFSHIFSKIWNMLISSGGS